MMTPKDRKILKIVFEEIILIGIIVFFDKFKYQIKLS